MIIERNKKEILVRLSPQTNTSDLQDMLDFIEYKVLVSKSKASKTEIEEIVKQVNRWITEKVRKARDNSI